MENQYEMLNEPNLHKRVTKELQKFIKISICLWLKIIWNKK